MYLRRRPPKNNMVESSEYASVLGHDAEADSFPSSFLPKKKKDSLFPRNFVIRRRINCLVLLSAFLVVGLLFSVELARRHGHLPGGAGSFLGQAVVTPDPSVAAMASKGLASMLAARRRLTVTTWNVAAINNNPFEYWITVPQEYPDYEKLMVDIEHFIDHPTAEQDLPVHNVFNQKMFEKLDQRFINVGWKSMKSYWDEDYSKRKIVSEFMKDATLGSKRLASMPDRITNTINVDGRIDPVCRPTVINMYDGDLSTLEQWWILWEQFMFDSGLPIRGQSGVVETKIPYKMLQPIKKSKYPDITEQEEADSLPLQTLCAAIFDAILVHMMNTVSKPDVWQPLKRALVDNLNKRKIPHTLQILETAYINSDIITLQEVSSALIEKTKSGRLAEQFYVFVSSDMDPDRDQNSIVLLNKNTFPSGPTEEITSKIGKAFPKAAPVAKGDLVAVVATTSDGVPLVVASFHGDTDGLATKPVLDAIVRTMTSDPKLISHKLIFGLDANTYEHPKPGKQQDVLDFGKRYVSHGLTSCWGDAPNPKNYTTYNARTFLQPQLNKACRSDEKRKKGDVNPKDFILFPKKDFEVESTWKDNTGEKKFEEDMAFPTFVFPSDHGILSTVIKARE